MPGHRDGDPVGPVVELVAQLVDGLLELEDRQQLVAWPPGPGGSSAGSTALEVALEERSRARSSQPSGAARAAQDAASRPRRRRTSAACPPRRAAASASAAARAAAAPARPRSRGSPSRGRRAWSGRGGSRRGCGSRARPRRRARAACSRSRTSWPRPADRRERLVVAAGRRRSARSPRRRRGEDRRAPRRSARSGANAGSRGLGAERRVQLAGDHAERVQRGRGTPRGRSPSSSSASSQPSRAPARYSCRIPERRVDQAALVLVPAGERRDVREARARTRKRSSSSSGLTPGSTRRNAFRISASPNTIDEFDCSTPTGRTSTVPPSARAAPAQRKRERAVARLHVGAGAHPVQQLARRAPGRRARRRRSSRRPRRSRARPSPRRPAGCRAAAGRARASPAGKRASISASTSSGDSVAQRDRLEHVEVRDLARLGAEPALGDDPLAAAPRRRGTERSPASSSRPRSSVVLDELEPVEAARREREQVRQLADAREARARRTARPGSGPRTADRSSSTACAERARLWTHSIRSSS